MKSEAQDFKKILTKSLEKYILRLLPKAFKNQNVSLAKIGETHKWLWDYHDIKKRLENAGAVAIMPLAAPIGSGLGIQNKVNISLIIKQSKRTFPSLVHMPDLTAP